MGRIVGRRIGVGKNAAGLPLTPLRRSADGFPVDLALQVLRSSNGLTTMTGMTMAVLTGDEVVAQPVSKIQPAFADCLPDLLRP